MRPYKLFIVIAVTVMLQVGFLPAWHPLHIVPDLLLAVVICLALYTTATEALLCAIITGLALDLSSGADFGLRLGFYTVVALSVSLLSRGGLALDSLPWRLGLSALLVILANVVVLLSLVIHGVSLPFGVVASRMIMSVIFEVILMIIVGSIIRRLALGGDGLVPLSSRGKA